MGAVVVVIILIAFFALFVYTPNAHRVITPPPIQNLNGTTTVTQSYGAICTYRGSMNSSQGQSINCGSYAYSGLMNIPFNPIYTATAWLAGLISSTIGLALFGVIFKRRAKATRTA